MQQPSSVGQRIAALLCVCLLALGGCSQLTATSAYKEIFYPSGSLRIQSYLYKPYGDGPFPVVIYNHGARHGSERRSLPFQHIGQLLAEAGYVVLVPERRGYGRSDGPTWPEEVQKDRARVVPRLQAETDDVLAGIDYLRTLPFADTKRIGIMGVSFGGIITMFAVSRSSAFVVAVNQAGGALTWDTYPEVRNALIVAAGKTTTPTLLQVAQNDLTTASISSVAEILKRRGVPHRAVIYEAFKPLRWQSYPPPGHRIFSPEGMHVWESDVLEFLGRYLGTTSPGTR
jgi:dienelactone hydrolase